MENHEQGKERFSKRLSQNEVEKCMIFLPFAAVASFLEFQEGRLFRMDVVDSLGKAWSFMGMFQSNEELGNYVSISWPQFATEKGLKANDEVIFMEKPRQEGEEPWKQLKVRIKRKIRLFGQDIWGELMV
ncbi:hypothetical protein V6N13_057894 [Hibiscus sabdariffa]|uniref:TF-B3 domain-containing protein n=1 Tax=Hibiscus sabdariffa TaxID=183260 RepID=A0ABR2GIT7_9ROSI